MNRAKFCDLVSHCFDNAPSPGQGAQRDGNVGNHDDPERDRQVVHIGRNAKIPNGEKQRDYDPDCLLCIIRAMAETVGRCCHELECLEV